MRLEFTPASLDDAVFYADVHTAVHPTEALDPLMQRHDWAHGSELWTADRCVVWSCGRRVGVGLMQHARWDTIPSRWADIGGDVLPADRDVATPRYSPRWSGARLRPARCW